VNAPEEFLAQFQVLIKRVSIDFAPIKRPLTGGRRNEMRSRAILILYPLVLCITLSLPFGAVPGAEAEKTRLVVQTGHSNSVAAVAVSPDGNLIATAYSSGVGIVKLWDSATAREVHTIEADPLSIGDVRFSPNGQLLASGGSDEKIRLWDVATAREVRVFSGHTDVVESVDFSPDGRWLASASGSKDTTVKLWDVATGDLVRTFAGHTASVRRVAFSPDGRLLASACEDRTVKLWEVATGQIRHTIAGHGAAVLDVAFSPNGRWIASAGGDKTIRIWNTDTGRQLRTLRGHTRSVYAVAFSSDGHRLASGGDHIKLWDPVTGREDLTLKSQDRTGVTLSLAFSPNGDWLVAGYWASVVKVWNLSEAREQSTLGQLAQSVTVAGVSPDGLRLAFGGDTTVSLWNLAAGRQAQVLRGHTNLVRSVAFSPDGGLVASAGDDRKVILWDSATGLKQRTLDGFDDAISEIAFSPNKVWLATGSSHSVVSARGDNTIKIWEVSTGRNVRTLTGHRHYVGAIAFNSDGSLLVSGSDDKSLKLWDPFTGRLLRTLTGHTGRVFNVAVSSDNRWIASGSDDGTVRLWEAATGRELRVFIADSRRRRRGAPPVAFSPDSRLLATGTDSDNVTLWDVTSGRPGQVLRGHEGHVSTLGFAPDGRRVISGSSDGTSRIWDVSTGEELIRLISFRSGTWAVVDPEGRYDASNGGDVEGLHWMVGHEPIALSQLKARYYEPGLLSKILGFNKEPIRDVQAFRQVALYPAIELRKPERGSPNLGIQLTNRGGGIGKVVVLINGKEMAADARGDNVIPHSKTAELTVDITNHPYLIPGHKNRIEVKAYNAEGYLSSRGVVVDYDAPGIAPSEIPTLWAIVAGVSDYSGEAIDLRYAAKDARDITSALQLGGSRLFGTERINLLVLSTLTPDKSPTKENLRQAFKRLQAAKPWDILVVYLAGHGVAQGDEYYYLTQAARTADLTDPAVREQVAISSSEMVEWIKQSPSTLQVMILDTCAAGTFEKKLSVKRDISSDQIRALDRMKDRTGFHVLMGSAADRVSYEATQYEQGLLTYALLKGMKGAALREQEFIDVSTLFNHAVDEVPRLAQNIGGIQSPRIAAPKGTSFDIGQLTAEDRQKIPLAQSKPFLLPPMFLNPGEGFDNLGLTALVRKKLRDYSYSSGRGGTRRLPVVYVEAEQFTGAFLPSGTYTVAGDEVQATLVLVRDQKRLIDLTVEGDARDPEALSAEIVERIMAAVQDLK
jgi:WD40 repeat protein